MKTNPETGAILASEILKGIERLESSNGDAVAAFEAELNRIDRETFSKPKGKRHADQR